ncbi:MAG: hypothetical protein R2856_23435 [Caldilineaceae bacterium]
MLRTGMLRWERQPEGGILDLSFLSVSNAISTAVLVDDAHSTPPTTLIRSKTVSAR